jgi:hypothetical protein
MQRCEAYATFRESADLERWGACLDAYRELEELDAAPKPEVLGELSQAICIAIYSLWLARLRGERDAEKQFKVRHSRLVRATRYCRQHVSTEARLAIAAAAASSGYAAVAASHCPAADAPLELAVLMIPATPEKRAELLKPKLDAMPGAGFLPAVYFYAHALLDLGYLDECRRAVDGVSGTFAGNPLMIDIAGQVAELSGDWSAARALYSESDWVTHRYRRAICDIFLAGEHGRQAEIAVVEDEAVLKAMGLWSGEIDQAEIARTELCVNACRWRDFDNWLLNFELGRLSFRRRRYSEADGLLGAAARDAPPLYAFAVNHLRFLNLTWLTGSTVLRDVPVVPEMLECGHTALEADAPEEKKAQIRTFLAREAGYISLLRPVFVSEANYEIANAYSCLKDMPGTIEYFCRTICEEYTPRALSWLANFFYRANFRSTAAYLVGIIIEESWDDFFVLWELASSLVAWEGDGALDEAHAAHLDRLVERLLHLCTNEFQHTIRAIEFFLDFKREDIVAGLLTRADQLAESAEERLQLARARRALSRGEVDMRSLENLVQAEKEATDRFVRLQIAREFALYGQIQQAREILKAEGLLDGRTPVSPIEYILALQCGRPCLTDDEIAAIGDAATKALGEALEAGTIRRYGVFFRRRLGNYRRDSNLLIEDEDHADDDPAEDSEWMEFKSDFDKTSADSDVEAERRLLNANVMRLEDASIFLKYALWSEVFRNFETLTEAVHRIRPDVDDAETPLTRSRLLLSGARARELSALWKDYFDPDREGAVRNAREALRRFRDRELELHEQWERERRKAMSVPLERLAFRSESLKVVLDSIRHSEATGNIWPTWLLVSDHILRDVRLLREKLSRHSEDRAKKPETEVV